VSAGAITVVAELSDGQPTGLTRELLGLGQRLARGAPLCAACPGADERAAAELIAYGADRVYTSGEPSASSYDSDIWTSWVAAAVRKAQSTVVLVGHTTSGADLAPRLAFRLDGGIATGCIEVTEEGGRLHLTRPCYGGNVRETVSFTTRLVVATVRGGCYDALEREPRRTGETVTIGADPAARRACVLERQRESGGDVRLEDARVVIAGGRGLSGPEGFDVLGALARELDGVVGASRVPCDLGWCPHSMQIGLTGKTVTPELYIAVGISGAGHHMAGCGNARNIVAINTDAEASIYKDARWGVVGDYRKIIPSLIAAIREIRAMDK